MKLEDQVVSLELAKKLRELGVKQESAFYWDSDSEMQQWSVRRYRGFYSAFTVAELGEMLPLWYYSKRLPDGSWSTDHVSRMDILNTNEKTEADSRAAMLIQIIERKIVRL